MFPVIPYGGKTGGTISRLSSDRKKKKHHLQHPSQKYTFLSVHSYHQPLVSIFDSIWLLECTFLSVILNNQFFKKVYTFIAKIRKKSVCTVFTEVLQ